MHVRAKISRSDLYGLCDFGALAAMARWSSWSLPSAAVPGAILVNRPTLEGEYLLLGQAVAISCATGIHAFVFSGVGRQQGEGRGICVARIEGSRPQWRKRCEDHEDADKVSPAVFHDLAPLGRKHRGLDVPTAMRILKIRCPATTREASPSGKVELALVWIRQRKPDQA
jgi:hypothetical protein